jgi:hypothetical protein
VTARFAHTPLVYGQQRASARPGRFRESGVSLSWGLI